MQEAGAVVTAYDPEARAQAEQHLKNIDWKDNPYDVAVDTDALVIITEWNEFRALDLKRIGELMKTKCLVDMRNIYKIDEMEKTDFHYISIGRPEVRPSEKAVLKSVNGS